MIYKRGKTYHFQFQQHGRRYRGSTGADNRAVALRVESEKRHTILGGGAIRPGAGSAVFSTVFAAFLEWAGPHVKPRTHQRYRVSGKRLCATFGSFKISELRANTIERFRVERCRECSNAGCNRDLACLRKFLNWCVEMDYVAKAPRVKLLPEDSHIVRSVSPAEEQAYMDKADLELRKLATLILETGMRPDEVFNLKPEFIRSDHVFVHQGKTKYARRTIPLTAKPRRSSPWGCRWSRTRWRCAVTKPWGSVSVCTTSGTRTAREWLWLGWIS